MLDAGVGGAMGLGTAASFGYAPGRFKRNPSAHSRHAAPSSVASAWATAGGTPDAMSAGPKRCSMSTLLLREPGVISAFGPRTQPPCTYEATIQSFTLCANAARVAFVIAAQSITSSLCTTKYGAAGSVSGNRVA